MLIKTVFGLKQASEEARKKSVSFKVERFSRKRLIDEVDEAIEGAGAEEGAAAEDSSSTITLSSTNSCESHLYGTRVVSVATLAIFSLL